MFLNPKAPGATVHVFSLVHETLIPKPLNPKPNDKLTGIQEISSF